MQKDLTEIKSYLKLVIFSRRRHLTFNSKIISVTSMFPSHMDLQYIGEVTKDNEKYRLLKPTIHTVEDYFQEYVLRRDTSDISSKKIFLDINGFRHNWSGLNLRKSDKLNTAEEPVNNNNNINGELKKDVDINILLAKIRDIIESIVRNGAEVTAREIMSTTVTENATVKVVDEKISNTDVNNKDNYKDENVINSNVHVNNSNNNTDLIKAPNVKTKPRRRKKVVEQFVTQKSALRKDKGKTKVKTSFFCPFFGIMTMTSYVDTEV